jgi:asparagine synthase (glutamine-hydrolysing)
MSPLRESIERVDAAASPLDKMLYLERRHFLIDHNLMYTDKTGMAAGVEIRVPLLDFDLIRYANSLPDDVRQKGVVGKWIFKQSMERYLPKDVIYRPKAGFGAPLRQWLRGPLKTVVNDVLSESSVTKRGLFDHDAIEMLITRDERGEIDAAYPIFAMISLELWCRQFIDGDHAVDADLEDVMRGVVFDNERSAVFSQKNKA